MSAVDDVKQVHREPHPFVSKDQLPSFVGKTIAFVGKVERVEEASIFMKTSDGKYLETLYHISLTFETYLNCFKR